MQNIPQIKDIPQEILLQIFSFINCNDIFTLQSLYNVCKEWRQIIATLQQGKPKSVTIGFVGPSGIGKTFTLGRILQLVGGFESIEHLDKNKEEKEVNRTLHLRRISFGIGDKREFGLSFLDIPGHPQQYKTMIRGIFQVIQQNNHLLFSQMQL